MAKARARQLPLTKAVDAQARKQNMLVGNQKDRGKTELAKLREIAQGPGPRHQRQEDPGGPESDQEAVR